MMTKQAELKQQAFASSLKSRALSVLIYLINFNKDLTCYPAIPTMAEQLWNPRLQDNVYGQGWGG